MTKKATYFFNSKNEASDKTTAIVPLVASDKSNGSTFFIGTSFYVSNQGILITAKHNVFDKDNKLFHNLRVVHFFPNKEFTIRRILNVTVANNYDIAYLIPEGLVDKDKNLIASDSLILTNNSPQIGDKLATYGFANTRLEMIKDNIKANFNPEFYLGMCKEIHINGFSLLKNACYQTSIQIKSGGSGGPVFDKDGRVFGICSTGIDLHDDGENISFVTPISPSFNMTLIDQNGLQLSITELIERKIITFRLPAANKG